MKGVLLAGLGIGVPMAFMIIGQLLWRADDNRSTTPTRFDSSAHPAQQEPTANAPKQPLQADQATVETPQPPDATLTDILVDWIDDWQERVRRSPEVQKQMAANDLMNGQYDQAVKTFDRLLVRRPNDPIAMIGKALALSRLGRHLDALPLFEHVLERQPDDMVTRFNYAVTLTRAGEYPKAVRQFETILQRQPRYARAAFNLAVLHQAAGRRQEALAQWRRLTDQASKELPSRQVVDGSEPHLDPTMLTQAWLHRSRLALALHLNDEAKQCYMALLKIDPNNASAWCGLGVARSALGQRDEAMEALNEALRRKPDDLPAINQLAFVHAANFRDTGRPTSRRQALELCQRSLAISSQQLNIRALRATLQKLDPKSPFHEDVALPHPP